MEVGAQQALRIPVGEHIVLFVATDAAVELEDGTFSSKLFLDDLPPYESFCDDFGPMNLASVYRFSAAVENILQDFEDGLVAICSHPDLHSLTNAVFLLGAYLIMMREMRVDDVDALFSSIHTHLLSYRDVSPGHQNFHLRLRDCWEGLFKAKQLEWINFAPDEFNLYDYETCDNPLNADLHEVVPGKFIAMRGPRTIHTGDKFEDSPQGMRSFSPAHYADILRQYDVQAVVRLNEPHYEAEEFEREGIAVADLPFEDCSTPPPELVAKFLAIAEGVPGALAVHCSAGLGRTGTLIAMYMIKHHGFTARQAIGWLRIVRPGSVIGVQQQYLCDSEAALLRAGDSFRRRGGALVGVDGSASVEEVARFIRAAIATADARASYILRCNSATRSENDLGDAAAAADAADDGRHPRSEPATPAAAPPPPPSGSLRRGPWHSLGSMEPHPAAQPSFTSLLGLAPPPPPPGGGGEPDGYGLAAGPGLGEEDAAAEALARLKLARHVAEAVARRSMRPLRQALEITG